MTTALKAFIHRINSFKVLKPTQVYLRVSEIRNTLRPDRGTLSCFKRCFIFLVVQPAAAITKRVLQSIKFSRWCPLRVLKYYRSNVERQMAFSELYLRGFLFVRSIVVETTIAPSS
jgi:hypothetical protein